LGTVASFATAAGTLVLAAATFSSIRSANRSARIAERSVQIGLRPILASSLTIDLLYRDHEGASASSAGSR
jgi:hypothetical protein